MSETSTAKKQEPMHPESTLALNILIIYQAFSMAAMLFNILTADNEAGAFAEFVRKGPEFMSMMMIFVLALGWRLSIKKTNLLRFYLEDLAADTVNVARAWLGDDSNTDPRDVMESARVAMAARNMQDRYSDLEHRAARQAEEFGRLLKRQEESEARHKASVEELHQEINHWKHRAQAAEDALKLRADAVLATSPETSTAKEN